MKKEFNPVAPDYLFWIGAGTLRLIDTHAHLDEFPDLNPVVERAKALGVVAVVAVGQGRASNEKTLSLAQTRRNYVFPALGIHPWEVDSDTEAALDMIEKNLDDCVAVGEIGLDYWIKKDKETQKTVFKKLLTLAAVKGKPVCVHTRGAWEDAYNLVKESNVRQGVFHWYSGPTDVLRSLLDNGYFISATPATEYSKAHREAVKNTPLDSLLLETDSPVKYKGVEAEPATVLKTLKFVAALKGLSEDAVSEKTTENAIKLFSLKL